MMGHLWYAGAARTFLYIILLYHGKQFRVHTSYSLNSLGGVRSYPNPKPNRSLNNGRVMLLRLRGDRIRGSAVPLSVPFEIGGTRPLISLSREVREPMTVAEYGSSK